MFTIVFTKQLKNWFSYTIFFDNTRNIPYKLSYKFKEKDSKEIVIDEFLGQSIPFLALYYLIHIENAFDIGRLDLNHALIYFLLFFAFFRFFDILKIFPINIIDKKMKNGLGVVLDDVVAGTYTAIIVYGIKVIFLWKI